MGWWGRTDALTDPSLERALASVWGRDPSLVASLVEQRGSGGGGIPHRQQSSFLPPNSSSSFTFNDAGLGGGSGDWGGGEGCLHPNCDNEPPTGITLANELLAQSL